jgi:hypothetical protein
MYLSDRDLVFAVRSKQLIFRANVDESAVHLALYLASLPQNIRLSPRPVRVEWTRLVRSSYPRPWGCGDAEAATGSLAAGKHP